MKCAFVDLGRHYGGAEYYLISLITAWIEAGNDAIILAKQGSGFAKKITGIFGESRVLCVGYTFKNLKNSKNFLLQNGIDIIHINGINSGLFIWAIGINIPKVTTVHSDANMDRIEKPFVIRKLFVIAEKFCLKKSNSIIVVSEAIKNSLVSRKISEKKIITINNGIQVIDYPKKHIRNDSDMELKVCYAGRLEEVKGCGYLLRALELCKDYRISCDIYGEGSLKNTLVQMVREFNIESMVCFKGYSNAMRDLLPNYDVLVMPSLFEASPLTILEAMNARTLVIASEVGGIPFIIDDKKNGYMFQAKNYEKLASILREIYKNPNEQQIIIENAYNYFINNYSFDVMRDRTFNVLKEEKN